MQYGYFDDLRREYVITDPRTPWPWINYLGTEDFFSLISNTAGGYSFYKDAKFRRITRYRYNNVPMDSGKAKTSSIKPKRKRQLPVSIPLRKWTTLLPDCVHIGITCWAISMCGHRKGNSTGW